MSSTYFIHSSKVPTTFRLMPFAQACATAKYLSRAYGVSITVRPDHFDNIVKVEQARKDEANAYAEAVPSPADLLN